MATRAPSADAWNAAGWGLGLATASGCVAVCLACGVLGASVGTLAGRGPWWRAASKGAVVAWCVLALYSGAVQVRFALSDRPPGERHLAPTLDVATG